MSYKEIHPPPTAPADAPRLRVTFPFNVVRVDDNMIEVTLSPRGNRTLPTVVVNGAADWLTDAAYDRVQKEATDAMLMALIRETMVVEYR